MNNEKQHSEYKIIETVATPTFDGISVETHPEKIEMSTRKIAYNIQSTIPAFIFGKIENNVLHLDVDSNETSWIAQNEGNIIASRGPGVQAKTWIMQQLSSVGINITDVVGNIVQYEEGQIVPDWSEYEKLNV